MGKLYVGGRLLTELESIPNPTDSSIPTGLDAFPEKFCKNKCVDRDELFVKLDVSGLGELDAESLSSTNLGSPIDKISKDVCASRISIMSDDGEFIISNAFFLSAF
ncbi:hypothetical protein AGMMS49936_11820 [Endomicrobiia bacterium]|nr:hypothetical protein AGMMS49936_11820 [Endomicrobiia bacterium]